MANHLKIEKIIFFVIASLYLLIYGGIQFFSFGDLLGDLVQLTTLLASIILIIYAIVKFKLYSNTLVLFIGGCLGLSRIFWAFGNMSWSADGIPIDTVLFYNMATISAKVLYIIILVFLITYFRPSKLSKRITLIEVLINVCYGVSYIVISVFEVQNSWVQGIQLVFLIILDINAIFLTLYVCKKFRNAMTRFDRVLLITSRIVYFALNFIALFVPYTKYIEPIFSLGLVIVFVSVLRNLYSNGMPNPLKTSWFMSIHKNLILLTFIFPTLFISMNVVFGTITQWLVVIGAIMIAIRQVLIGIEDHFTITRFEELNENFDGVVEVRMQDLLVSEQKYHSLFNQMEEALVILDDELNVVRHNPALELFLREHLIVEHLEEGFQWIIGQNRDVWNRCISQVQQNEKIEFYMQFQSNNYEMIHLEIKAFPYLFQERIQGVLILMKDQTRFLESQRNIEDLAYIDQLTQLWTRHYFLQQMEPELGTKFMQASLLFMDLNHFKKFNDRYGHHIGDAVLKEFAQRTREVFGSRGTICRFSGDEFIVLLPNQGQLETEQQIVQFLQHLTMPFEISGTHLSMGASIGIACYPQDGATLDELVNHADMAMYHVKRNRNQKYCFYDRSVHTALRREDILQQEMQRCVSMNQLELHYQPQYDIMDEQMIGAEALLRWNHPELGVVSPLEFIPLAERNGFIHEMGNWVIEEVCRQMKVWEKVGLALPISINVSLEQLNAPSFVTQMMNKLMAYHIDFSMITVEVTESIATDNIEYTASILKELYASGISISLDDFGTGYSSLSCLMSYPIDNLKIDRAFIRDISSPQKVKLVDTIVQMAEQLGVHVIAEGVETKEQLDYLRNINCRYIQGYYFSKPIASQEMTALLLQHKSSAHQENMEQSANQII